MSALRIATWNVHGCVGLDGRERPERVADVIRALAPDIIGLQEMRDRALARIASLTGLRSVAGATRREGSFHFGNALLTRLEVTRIAQHDVSYGRREPRGVLDVTLRRPAGELVRVLVTHFGLSASERRAQADLLLRLVRVPRASLLTLLGDFNEWRPFASTLAQLDRHLGTAIGLRTFPSFLPLLRLDRIWVWPPKALRELDAQAGHDAWKASDHLPVTAVVDPEPA